MIYRCLQFPRQLVSITASYTSKTNSLCCTSPRNVQQCSCRNASPVKEQWKAFHLLGRNTFSSSVTLNNSKFTTYTDDRPRTRTDAEMCSTIPLNCQPETSSCGSAPPEPLSSLENSCLLDACSNDHHPTIGSASTYTSFSNQSPHHGHLSSSSSVATRGTVLRSSVVCGLRPTALATSSPSRCLLHTTPRRPDIYIIENEDEFERKVMGSKLPVVINFHADWCEPCHELKPLLESLAEKHNGKMHLAEVKIDDHVALLHAFEVTAVPAVLGVVGGQVTEKFIGLISEAEVRAFVNTMIGE